MSLNKTITTISSETCIDSVTLSPSASQVIYRLSRQYNPFGTPHTASLWISSLTAGSKSRQLTSGEYNDSSPVWSMDENAVYFLSNRNTEDSNTGPVKIWALPLKTGGEAHEISSTKSKSPIGSFWLSPDGQHIAYTAVRDQTDEEKRRDEEKDDAIVSGDIRHNAQLWLLNIETGQARRLTLGYKDSWH
ncbi:hypothetical protein CALCODRAFT_510111, partial [Calocera cornea HHB12733]